MVRSNFLNEKEAIETINIQHVEYVSVHCSDGRSYSLLRSEIPTDSKALVNWSDYLFLAINMVNGELKIIQKYEKTKIHCCSLYA